MASALGRILSIVLALLLCYAAASAQAPTTSASDPAPKPSKFRSPERLVRRERLPGREVRVPPRGHPDHGARRRLRRRRGADVHQRAAGPGAGGRVWTPRHHASRRARYRERHVGLDRRGYAPLARRPAPDAGGTHAPLGQSRLPRHRSGPAAGPSPAPL